MGMHPIDSGTPLRLTQATSLNDAIKLVSDGDPGAASIIAAINSQYPQDIMTHLHALDAKRVYGHNIYHMYWDSCYGNLAKFLTLLSA